MGLFGLFRRKPFERTGFELYTAAVAAARDPAFFAGLGVPDTLDGRFDLVGLHAALLIRRLRNDEDTRGAELAQAVFDAMFADMDINLREMGVGDLSVGKRVRSMWEAFHGRAFAYEAALASRDEAALAEALARNVWRGETPGAGPDGRPSPAAQRLAAYVVSLDQGLAGQPFSEFLAGRVDFVPRPAFGPAVEAA